MIFTNTHVPQEVLDQAPHNFNVLSMLDLDATHTKVLHDAHEIYTAAIKANNLFWDSVEARIAETADKLIEAHAPAEDYDNVGSMTDVETYQAMHSLILLRDSMQDVELVYQDHLRLVYGKFGIDDIVFTAMLEEPGVMLEVDPTQRLGFSAMLYASLVSSIACIDDELAKFDGNLKSPTDMVQH